MSEQDRKLELAAGLLSHMLELPAEDQLDVIAYAIQGWVYKYGRERWPDLAPLTPLREEP